MSLGPAVRQIAAQLAGDGSAPDADLLGRFVSHRDEAAFAVLVDRHGPLVRGACGRLLGHSHDAEDAAQAVFLVLARCAGRVRNRASVASWLHGVAVRVCRKGRARRAGRPAARPLPADAAAAPGPADPVTWAEVRAQIDDALAELPETFRQPLVLCYLQGLTRDEAAARLGWSLSTFRGRLERGRDRLRAALHRRGLSLSGGLAAVLLSDAAAAASPGWSAAVTAAVAGGRPVPVPVLDLANGARLPMNRAFVLWPAAVVAGGLVAWLAAAAVPPPAGPDRPPPAAGVPPAPPGRLFKADPKAPPAADQLKGTWAGEIVSPDKMTKREMVIRFVDGTHTVWTVNHVSPGVRAGSTTRFRYELKDGDLRLETLERFNGEEKLAVRDDDRTREYSFKWVTEDGKAGFRVVNKTAPDSPWAAVTFRRTAAPAGGPPAAGAAPAVDRTILKEPKYEGTPRYLLLAFGPEAKFRVWVVLDGATLYVDRNGNGDLTDPGEKVPAGGPPVALSPAFFVGALTDPATNTRHTDFLLGTIRLESGGAYARGAVRVGGKVLQVIGPTDLRLTETPAEARVVRFGSPAVTVIPSHTMQSTPDANEPADFRVQVGTPGAGPGSFAAYGSEQLPDGIGPVAEFEFPSAAPGGAAKRVTLKLSDRCCNDQFFAKLTVPEGAKAGVGVATVRLSFPDCPWGKVEPAAHPVDVIPKKQK